MKKILLIIILAGLPLLSQAATHTVGDTTYSGSYYTEYGGTGRSFSGLWTAPAYTGVTDSTVFYWDPNYGASTTPWVKIFVYDNSGNLIDSATCDTAATSTAIDCSRYSIALHGGTIASGGQYRIGYNTGAATGTIYTCNQSAVDQYYYDDVPPLAASGVTWTQQVGAFAPSIMVFYHDAASAPSVPTLSSPADAATGQIRHDTLWWHPSTGTGTITYQVQVATDAGFTSTIFDQSSISDTFKVITGDTNSTAYYWHVRSSNGAASAYSTARSFTTAAQPTKVTLIYPDTAATGMTVTDTLKWHLGTSASQHRIQVSTSNTFNTTVKDSTAAFADTTLIITGLSHSQPYYWRVNYTNIYGTSAWSNTWVFTTVAAPVSRRRVLINLGH